MACPCLCPTERPSVTSAVNQLVYTIEVLPRLAPARDGPCPQGRKLSTQADRRRGIVDATDHHSRAGSADGYGDRRAGAYRDSIAPGRGNRVGSRTCRTIRRNIRCAGRDRRRRGADPAWGARCRCGDLQDRQGRVRQIRQTRYRIALGRSVPVVGRYHAAGDGRTGETIGTIIVGGVVAGAFVTGHNVVFEEGRQFTAFTGEATRIARPAMRLARYASPAVPPAMSFARGPALVSPSYAAVAYSPPAAMPVPPAYVADGSFAQKLAAAQPVRGGDPRLGWMISD